MNIKLHVNGQQREVQVNDPQTPLMYVLRNQLTLNGPKFGCGLGQCSACMVLMDGKAVPSCSIPVSSIKDKHITTLEGLVKDEKLHPVQEAFVKHQAAQCGYCLNGMVVAAVSILNDNKNPDDAAINQGMQRVLCRCGVHSRVKKAIESAIESLNG